MTNDDLFAEQLSARLALRMQCLDLRQREVAKELQVSQQTVSKWLSGDAVPETRKLPALAAVLRMSVDALIAAPACRIDT